MSKFDTLTITQDGGVLGDIEITVEYTYSYTPGNLSGPYENSYPAEEEFEIIKAVADICGHKVTVCIDDAAFEDQCLEIAAENFSEMMRESKADYDYERQSIYRECD